MSASSNCNSGCASSPLTTSRASGSVATDSGRHTRGAPGFLTASQSHGVTYHMHICPSVPANLLLSACRHALNKSAPDGAANAPFAGSQRHKIKTVQCVAWDLIKPAPHLSLVCYPDYCFLPGLDREMSAKKSSHIVTCHGIAGVTQTGGLLFLLQ